MTEVLSQQEIEQLLNSISSGEITPEDLAKTAVKQRLKIYDFKRPDKFTKDQIRTLAMIHETFARLTTTGLSAQLKALSFVHVASVDQLTYEEFVRSIPNPTTLAVIDMEPLEGNAVLEIDPSITYVMIDKLFGGNGKFDLRIPRELTEIESAVIEGIIVRALGNLREAWSNIIDLRPRLGRIEINPQFTQIVPPSDMVIIVTFEAKIGEVEGQINLCIPYITIEKIMPKLKGQYWYGVRQPESNKTKNVLKDKTKSINIKEEIILEAGDILLNDYQNIKEGDMLPIKSFNEIALLIEGKKAHKLHLIAPEKASEFEIIDKKEEEKIKERGDEESNEKNYEEAANAIREKLKEDKKIESLTDIDELKNEINKLNQEITKISEQLKNKLKDDELIKAIQETKEKIIDKIGDDFELAATALSSMIDVDIHFAVGFVFAMGMEYSSKIYSFLEKDAIERVTLGISRNEIIDSNLQYESLVNFYNYIESRQFIEHAGFQHAKQLLEASFGKEKASEVINNLTAGLQVRPFDFIKRCRPEHIINLIIAEHPQTIALIISHLESDKAAVILETLPDELRSEVSQRIAIMDVSSPEVLREIERVLEKKLSMISNEDYIISGGIENLIDLLVKTLPSVEKSVIESLKKSNPELGEEIEKRIFPFEDIVKLKNVEVQKTLREVGSSALTKAMKHTSSDVKEKIFSNMSKRAGDVLKEDIDFIECSEEESQIAQKQIVSVIRDLIKSGDIFVSRE